MTTAKSIAFFHTGMSSKEWYFMAEVEAEVEIEIKIESEVEIEERNIF